MKKIILPLILVVIFIASLVLGRVDPAVSTATLPKGEKTVVLIDAGHGGLTNTIKV